MQAIFMEGRHLCRGLGVGRERHERLGVHSEGGPGPAAAQHRILLRQDAHQGVLHHVSLSVLHTTLHSH